MKLLLFGSAGQLGWEIQQTCPAGLELKACDRSMVDLTDPDQIKASINSYAPDCIINAAAYTHVDAAEKEEARALEINGNAPRIMAECAATSGIRLVHISTDYVFNGKSFCPYTPEDPPHPESAYGRTKLEGEQAILDSAGKNATIIRTAWLYSSHGSNFVKTILGKCRQKNPIHVVDDQIGTPTWANGLARAIWEMITLKLGGLFHWTDAGVASWYDFAVAIQEEGLSMGLIPTPVPILPVSSPHFKTAAKRPQYSVLDKTKLWGQINTAPEHWRVQLRRMLKELAQ